MNRNVIVYDGEDVIDEYEVDVNWMAIRARRDDALKSTDHWALKDRVMSQEKRDYREFLRGLGDLESANDAADAWAAYDIPE
jgi:hypothetical protein